MGDSIDSLIIFLLLEIHPYWNVNSVNLDNIYLDSSKLEIHPYWNVNSSKRYFSTRDGRVRNPPILECKLDYEMGINRRFERLEIHPYWNVN